MDATTRPEPTGTPRGSFLRLYRLVLRHQLTWGRAAVVLGLGGLATLVGLAVRAESRSSGAATVDGTEFLNAFGFTTIVPVCALMFASSALGDMVDDRTLVYVWLTPVQRFWMALAATLASITVALPLALVPLTVAAAATGAGPELVWATALATAVGTVGYCGLFTALGLRFRRALVWGIAYILVWEGFVATASEAAASLSIRAYTASILSQATGVGLRLGTLTMASGIIVPPLVCVVAIGLTTWLLIRTDVD
jgi:ABC-2 type transport system permease protein